MSIVALLYFTDVLYSLGCFSIGIAVTSCILGGISGGLVLFGDEDFPDLIYTRVKRFFKFCVVTFVLSGTLIVFIPSKTTMVTWIGINTLQTVKSEVQNTELYNKVMKLLNKKVDELMKEPKESK